MNVMNDHRHSTILAVFMILVLVVITGCSFSSNEKTNIEKNTAKYNETNYGDFKVFSRSEVYQPGVRDIHVVLENISNKEIVLKNSVTLEREEKSSWVKVNPGEHYLDSLREMGVDVDYTNEGVTTLAPQGMADLFWLVHFMTEEDGTLPEGNYHLVFHANNSEYTFAFSVNEDGWDGKPHSYKELNALPGVLYKGTYYFRDSIDTDSVTDEKSKDGWEEIGKTVNVPEEQKLTEDMQAHRILDNCTVYYDSEQDRIVVMLSDKNYLVLPHKSTDQDRKNWKD